MSQTNLIQDALEKAKQDGYIFDFFFTEDGYAMSIPDEVSSPKIVEIIPCLSCGATLYRIECNNTKGTYIDHWII